MLLILFINTEYLVKLSIHFIINKLPAMHTEDNVKEKLETIGVILNESEY